MGERPSTTEYASYFERYIDLVPEGNIVEILTNQLYEIRKMLETITEEESLFQYDVGKWSIKEVLGHMTDNERICAYRLLRIARGDQLVFTAYEQEQFIREAQFNRVSFHDLLEEFTFVRRSTILMLQGLTEESWSRQGELYNSKLTVRAAAYVIVGHVSHHETVLKKRYLSQDI